MILRQLLPWCVALAACGPILPAQGTEPPGGTSQAADAERIFVVRIKPLLKAKCAPCHGDDPDDLKGDFDIRSRAAMQKGGESGDPALVPGDTQASLLLSAVRWEDLEMPPKENDRLSSDQVEWIREWIDAGAPWPDAERQKKILADQWSRPSSSDGILVRTSGGLSDQWTYRRYQPDAVWAYRPVSRPAVPWSALPARAPRHPIDAFIQRKLNQKHLRAAGRADRRTLIRRITYDLTGLPPSPQDIEQFVADRSADAYERLVDRLLESPRYGEQWARHWLDVTRYADTSGFSRDDARPNAWRFRDYVIRSFNDDKPFDRFILEQVAGDELDPQDPELLIAAGYLRMGPWEHTGMSVAAVTRQQYLDDVTNAIGETFLGQILRCAKCHDHKFDPLPTRDYYRTMAALASVQLAEREAAFLPSENTSGFGGQRQRYRRLIQETQAEQRRIKEKERLAQIDWLIEHTAARGTSQGKSDSKPGAHRVPSKRELLKLNAKALSKLIAQLPKDERPPRHQGLSYKDLGVLKVLSRRMEYLERQLLTFEPFALSVYSGPYRQYSSNRSMMAMPAKLTGEVETIHILSGGSLASPLETVAPGVLSAVSYSSKEVRDSQWNAIPSSPVGRRLALARWIANPNNSLTARVIVNRIWQHHFAGKGIVATPNNFGVMGKRPTHPELLDFLAAWFIEHGWSIKALHRLILTSETYRRSGTPPNMDQLRQTDPNNSLLACYPPRRLAAEEIRDSLLFAGGELNFDMGGPAVYPEINREVALQPIHVMGSVAPAWQPSPTRAERNRRTIYVYRQRNRGFPLLEVFNRPSSGTSCERRDQTTVTPQALTLLNSQNSHDRALAMAARIAGQASQPAKQIALAFRLAYGRSPTKSQLEYCLDHWNKMVEYHRGTAPSRETPASSVERHMIEEMTGEEFSWTETLDVYASGHFEPDLKPWDVHPETRALAEICLVLFNSNEFLYVY